MSRRLGARIANVLRYGTLLAVGTIAIGFGVALVGGEASPGARPIIELVAAGGGDAVASIGLLALTLLPLGVLTAAALTFGADGERRYLVACLVTLGLLVGSLVVAGIVIGPG